MAETLLPCVCGETASKAWATVTEIEIVECRCGVRRVARIDKDAYESLYTSGKYHTEGSNDCPHTAEPRGDHKSRLDHDLDVARARCKRLSEYADGGKLMDVGCANGAFMLIAEQEFGFEIEGVDLSHDGLVSMQLKPLVRIGDLCRVGFQRRSADVITFNDSFEHFVDPLSALKAANGILKRDGILVIEIPDMGCQAAIDEKSEFKHVKPHEHLWYFTATQLRNLLESNGFTVIGMNVPIPGKVTAYASPACTVNDIEVQGPPGVGDTLWTLQKLAPIYRKEYPCRIKYTICSSGGQKQVTRARDFLLLCPYIHSIDFKNLDGQPLPRDVGCSDPSVPIYELFPNDYLEPKGEPFVGGFIENWRPELENDWNQPFEIPRAAIEQARHRLKKFSKYVTVYMSSHVWNAIVSEPHWTPAHWAELLIKLRASGYAPIILGAGADADYANTVASEIVKLGHDPALVWINTIDRTPLPLAMAYMQGAAVTVGVANGLPMLPLYTGAQSIIFWPTRKKSSTRVQWTPEFEVDWLPVHIRKSGRYTNLVVGEMTVQSFYNEIMRKVERIQNAAS